MYREILAFLLLIPVFLHGQIYGTVKTADHVLSGATVLVSGTATGSITDSEGKFTIQKLPPGNYQLIASYTGMQPVIKVITVEGSQTQIVNFNLVEDLSLSEVVVSGNLKPVKRLESTIPVEVYSARFLKQNPVSNVFEGLQNINGVRPQLNCSVCNTGDIHINGLEGPYTFVLIDGMPIMSSLASVYGLSGIPTGMIEKLEVVKGPAGTLYGSQAVGGLINVITKIPETSPTFFVDQFTTSWLESNLDIGLLLKVGKKSTAMTGINFFWYDNPMDLNHDEFTDLTLQKRFSFFEKYYWKRSKEKSANVVFRYLYEDRWGGEMNWNPSFRGTNEVYGESIYTKRFEVFGNYPLSLSKDVDLQFSYTDHNQNSYYGDTSYQGREKIGFGQMVWKQNSGIHSWLGGMAFRYTWYDDNTPATLSGNINQPNTQWLPGIFVENEMALTSKQKLLVGGRLDVHNIHGAIFTPRLGYKLSLGGQVFFRLNYGTGFRVVNLFTEDHAALSGARDVIIEEALAPEQSQNINVNFYKKAYTKSGWILGFDYTLWYTHFKNQILPDYDSNPNQIRYANLDGYAISKGNSINIEASRGAFITNIGMTLMNVFTITNGIRKRPVFTENWSATWNISIPFTKIKSTLDYTGNVYGPMRLPLLGALDPRKAYSPIWSIQNVKVSYRPNPSFSVFGGVKNLLNWTPAKNNPFLIARANDPFDKQVSYDTQGEIVPTPENPYALSFDPSYMYASNQGIRFFVGMRVSLF